MLLSLFFFTLFHLSHSQTTEQRTFFLDASKGEGTSQDKYHIMDYLQVWDHLELHFLESNGYTWIVDPSHNEEEWFVISGNRIVKD